MSHLSTIPVELWWKILEAVIHVPYVLDTTVPTEGSFWHHQDVYHIKEPYYESEKQRQLLRLVCKSWKRFADENQFRWIMYQSYISPQWDQKEAEDALRVWEKRQTERALQLAPSNEEDSKSRPRRILFEIRSTEDMNVFQRTITHYSVKLTTLFVNCSDKFGIPIFDQLIAQSALLPCLRCLMLKAVDFRGTPLLALSSSFPKLTGLTLERGFFPHNPDDYLSLSQLESLYLDMRTLAGMQPMKWHMPYLVRLSLPLNSNDEEASTVISFIQRHGNNLTFLHLNANVELTLPRDLWTWCPKLTEVATCFSRVLLEGPIPVDHPLTYLVHFLTDLNWRHSTFLDLSMEKQPRIVRNIQLLPPGFLSFVVAITRWTDNTKPRPPENAMERFWADVSAACVARGIRLEDERGKTFDECFIVV